MPQPDTATSIARALLADCGTHQAAMDFLIDQRIDARNDRERARLEELIAAVERATLH